MAEKQIIEVVLEKHDKLEATGITIPFDVENDAALLSLLCVAKSLRTEKHAEFERHVETREPGRRIGFGSRQIVNAEPAVCDDAGDSLDPYFAGVIDFERTARDVSAVVNSKNDRLEKMTIGVVKRAIHEDRVFVPGSTHRADSTTLSSIAALICS